MVWCLSFMFRVLCCQPGKPVSPLCWVTSLFWVLSDDSTEFESFIKVCNLCDVAKNVWSSSSIDHQASLPNTALRLLLNFDVYVLDPEGGIQICCLHEITFFSTLIFNNLGETERWSPTSVLSHCRALHRH